MTNTTEKSTLPPARTLDSIYELDCVFSPELRQSHMDAAVARGLPTCTVRPVRNGKVAVVGSGPSVTEYVDVLRAWDGEIWGINGSFAWMRHRGVKPTGFVGLDPEPVLLDYLADIPYDVVYYMATQVHPSVLDHLAGKNVQLWFNSDRDVKFPHGAILVPGGTSCMGRAPYLACMLGWQAVHLFGCDSSFTHKTHVHGGDIPPNFCFVESCGQLFKTTRVMFHQACDLVVLVQNFPGTIAVHGTGLFQTMCMDVQRSGIFEALEAEETAILGHLNRRERRAMKANGRKAHEARQRL